LRLRPTFRQPSSQSPAFAFDQPSGSTFPSTVDLRLRSTFRFRLCIDLRLAPPADPPADFPTDLQLAPSINPPAKPSGQPSTCVSDQPSGSALCIDLRLASPADLQACLPTNLQLAPSNQSSSSAFQPTYLTCVSWSTFRLSLKPNLRLSSAAASSGCLSNRSATCAAYRSSGSASAPTSDFRLRSASRLRVCANLQLSPSTSPPAVPSVWPPDFRQVANLPAAPSNYNLRLSSVVASLGAAVRLTLGFRRRSTFQPCLWTQLPTFIECCALRPCLPTDLRLASPIQPSGYLSIEPSACASGPIFRLPSDQTCGSRLRSIFRLYLRNSTSD